jgi:hypothetical protein
MLAASYQTQQNKNVAQVNNQNTDSSVLQQQSAPAPIQSLRLRDDPPPITPTPRNSRKRKTPPSVIGDQTPQQQPQQQHHQHSTPPIATVQHSLPPAHSMVQHPPTHMQPHPLPQGYQYDYSPGGMPIPPPNQPSNPADHEQSQSPPNSAAGRTLSSSKRAEQNRKAQRAFRERRDQYVLVIPFNSTVLTLVGADTSKPSSLVRNCSTPPSLPQTKPTDVGKNVVPSSISYVLKILLCGRPSALYKHNNLAAVAVVLITTVRMQSKGDPRRVI